MVLSALISFLAGVGIAASWGAGFSFWLVVALASFCTAFFRNGRTQVLVLVCMLTATVGIVRFSYADRPSPLETRGTGQAVLTGFVDGDFERETNGGRFLFRVLDIDGQPISERILVQTDPWPEYHLGDVLEMSGELERPWAGDGFDYRSYLKKDGVRMVIRRPTVGPSGAEIPFVQNAWLGTRQKLFAVRDLMSGGIHASVPEPAAAYLNGILLGMRQDLPADVSDAFSRTGTSHVLAISGYNIALVAQGLMLVFLRVTGRRRATWLAVAGVAAFAVLTGASASVVRAAIMGSLLLVALSWGKEVRIAALICLAAAVMVAINPYILRFDVGFQLSFAAVLGMVYLAPMLERLWTAPKPLTGTWQLAAATGAANAATLPLILTHFGTLPIYALPANIIILPLVPHAMAFGAAAGLFSLAVPQLAGIAGIPALALASVQLNVVTLFSRLPGATLDVPLPWTAAAAVYAAMLVMCFHAERKRGHAM